MSKITSQILQQVAPGTPRAKRDRFLADFNRVLPKYGITTELRVAAFLTTVCFESDYFKALAEYADGWAYDISRNRKKALELGNTEVGDGPKYKGAGGIETTGKKNYQRLSDRLGVDFVKNPMLLRTEQYFVEAACVFWDDNNFNTLADKGKITAIQNITNRGDAAKPAKALSSRITIYHKVLDVLPDDFALDGADDPLPDAPTADIPQADAPAPGALAPDAPPPTQQVNVTADTANLAVPPVQNQPQDAPITVQGIVVGLWTKVLAAFAALTGLGINAGTFIDSKLENITLNQIFVMIIGAGLIVLAVWYFKKRQEAADLKTHTLIAQAANPNVNTVILK